MNLSTNSIISLRYPINSLRGITTSYLNKPQFFINIDKDIEVPIYLLDKDSLMRYDYATRQWRWNGGYSRHLAYYDVPMKVLGTKFYDCFKHLGSLKKYSVSDKSYFIGKGIITDEFFEPLILTTYSFGDDDLQYEGSERRFKQEKIKVYLNRTIFTEEFRVANKRLHREIINIILPDLMQFDIKISIKRELNMLNVTHVDASLNINQLQEKFRLEAEDAKRKIIRELS